MEVVLVNHNTSSYAELALRSLFDLNDVSAWGAHVTVLDNSSSDDTTALKAFLDQVGIEFSPSGFTTDETANTHGEILARFVLSSRPTDSFLFLDADVCFLEEATVDVMRSELAVNENIWAVQARLRWFVSEALGIDPAATAPEYLDHPHGMRGRIFDRPHPFCLLVRDGPVFRSIVEKVGLSCAWRYAASPDVGGWYDTFALAAAAMSTHGLRWVESAKGALHYAQAAERHDPVDLMALKDRDCQDRLRVLRAHQS
jgi:GT2 family glycosyltransferase